MSSSQQIIIPNTIKKGDKIGIVAPSKYVLGEERELFDKGVSILADLGLEPVLGEHIFDRYFYSAGKVEDRAADFNAMWQNPEIKMIITARGGETANTIIEYINWEAIRSNPKIFLGFSDITVLLNLITEKTGLVTFHGSDIMSLPYIGEYMIEDFKKTYMAKELKEYKPYNSKMPEWKIIRKGKAVGRIMGGNFDCFNKLLVTGYEQTFKDKILFLESADMSPKHWDWALSALTQRGALAEIKGLVIGYLAGYDECKPIEMRDIGELVLEKTKEYSYPIMQIGELGHFVENYNFPIGASVEINTDRGCIKMNEYAVK